MLVDYPVEGFIVRIYQRQNNGSGRMRGIVESQNAHDQFPFTTPDELWSILSATKRNRPQR